MSDAARGVLKPTNSNENALSDIFSDEDGCCGEDTNIGFSHCE